MVLSVRVCEDGREWDALVEKSPHATVFHTWKFLRIIEKHGGGKLYPLIGLEGTTPIGVFPLFHQKKPLFSAVFSPPPHYAVPYLGPLIADYGALKQDKRENICVDFQREVDRFIREDLHAGYVYISTSPGLIDARPYKWAGYCVEPQYTYHIDLSEGKEAIRKRLKKNLRRDIDVLVKQGASVEEGGMEALNQIMESVAERYGDQGRSVAVPREYISEVYGALAPDNMKIILGRSPDGKYAGGMINLCYRGVVSSWIGSAKQKSGMSVNDLVQWRSIEWACDNGYLIYEEMGANTERLRRYKSKFNPSLQVHYSAKKCYSPHLWVAEQAYLKVAKPLLGVLRRR